MKIKRVKQKKDLQDVRFPVQPHHLTDKEHQMTLEYLENIRKRKKEKSKTPAS